MEAMGVPFFGCNLGVGLALAIPGLRIDVARGLLGDMAHGNSSIVGVTSLQEAVKVPSKVTLKVAVAQVEISSAAVPVNLCIRAAGKARWGRHGLRQEGVAGNCTAKRFHRAGVDTKWALGGTS